MTATSQPRRQNLFNPTDTDFIIWWATCGNGQRTGFRHSIAPNLRRIRRARLKDTQKSLRAVHSCATRHIAIVIAAPLAPQIRPTALLRIAVFAASATLNKSTFLDSIARILHKSTFIRISCSYFSDFREIQKKGISFLRLRLILVKLQPHFPLF